MFKTGYGFTVALKTQEPILEHMDIQTRDTDRGTEIRVKTDEKIALVVDSGEGERIYLPAVEGDDSSYYVEDPMHLQRVENGYQVIHTGEVESVEVIS